MDISEKFSPKSAVYISSSPTPCIEAALERFRVTQFLVVQYTVSPVASYFFEFWYIPEDVFSQVIIAMIVHIIVFWAETPCVIVGSYQLFG
jgi:hypothetical protein